ncbi:AMP-binding protein [Thalassomonas viridans]|uniref:AMP-binding protein n=1 Tax=Thalassomonas viridans TaxID=137584 RepID=A0AAE9ZBD0_9GAMM|nr:AMP-binding protein [Thalassomonas viridans]WDE09219.1 AMP-binding protein [Thalassomonas viridans]
MNQSIIDYLHQNAVSKPNAVAFRFLSDTGHAVNELTCSELWHEAHAVAKFLTDIAEPGSRIMLFYPPGLSYIKAFYGCLIAGMIAVPLYPPKKNSKSTRIVKVAQSCQARIALTNESELSAIRACWQQHNTSGLELTFHTTDQISAEATEELPVPEVDPSLPAFLQYTSGSTGSPKGVIITHGNIIGNVEHLTATSHTSEKDVFVNWLPLFHDLGLITAILWPVYLGAPSTLMAPATFVRNPVTWLKAITDYKGTMCGAPNFAYDLCCSNIKASALDELDLSSWRVAYNAAEPVNAKTLENFTAKFSRCGFTGNRFYPGYGMAEATVFITGGSDVEKPYVLKVNKQSLAEHQVKPAGTAELHSSRLVSCGSAALPHDVRIVNPESHCESPEGVVGEIWFSGPSVSPGYWGLEELSGQTFGQKIVDHPSSTHRYLRTGDLGAMWQGELYVTGRMKDLIILNGVNYYPQDIEESAVNAHEAIRHGYNAAFSLAEGEGEKLVVVTELERKFFRSVEADVVINAIRKQVFDDHQVHVDRVVLLKPNVIPKTSSGKIQRNQTRILLASGEIKVLALSNDIAAQDVIPPQTSVEKVIHTIWCYALKRNAVSITDSFFDIGGDSILAMQISAEIEKAYSQLSFDMEQLLELATIKDIARYIELKILHQEANPEPILANSPGILKI